MGGQKSDAPRSKVAASVAASKVTSDGVADGVVGGVDGVVGDGGFVSHGFAPGKASASACVK